MFIFFWSKKYIFLWISCAETKRWEKRFLTIESIIQDNQSLSLSVLNFLISLHFKSFSMFIKPVVFFIRWLEGSRKIVCGLFRTVQRRKNVNRDSLRCNLIMSFPSQNWHQGAGQINYSHDFSVCALPKWKKSAHEEWTEIKIRARNGFFLFANG